MSEDIEALRAEIDRLDDLLLSALAARSELARRVGAEKRAAAKPLRDPAREAIMLEERLGSAERLGLPRYVVRQLFRTVIEHSLRVQSDALFLERAGKVPTTPIRVLYQGAPGSYSQLAAERIASGWQGDVSIHGAPTFRAMLEAVQSGRADFALLPVENTTAGSINESYDLLLEFALFVVGETRQRVKHCLLTLDSGVEVTQLRRVISHPQALLQCSTYLGGLLQCSPEPFVDTALAAEEVRRRGDRTLAAIASEEAGRIHGLHVAAKDIANQKGNWTRMLLVAASRMPPPDGVPVKSSIVFGLRHEGGALYEALQVFAEAGVSLTKLESRPHMGRPWEYVFYADFEGTTQSGPGHAAVQALAARASFVRDLGTYAAEGDSQVSPVHLRRPPWLLDEGVGPAASAPQAGRPVLLALGRDYRSAIPALFVSTTVDASDETRQQLAEALDQSDATVLVLRGARGRAEAPALWSTALRYWRPILAQLGVGLVVEVQTAADLDPDNDVQGWLLHPQVDPNDPTVCRALTRSTRLVLVPQGVAAPRQGFGPAPWAWVCTVPSPLPGAVVDLQGAPMPRAPEALKNDALADAAALIIAADALLAGDDPGASGQA